MKTLEKSIIPFGFVISFFLMDYNSFIRGIKLSELILIIVTAVLLFRNRVIQIEGTKKVIILMYVVALVCTLIPFGMYNFDTSLASKIEVCSRVIRYLGYVIFIVVGMDVSKKEKTLDIFRVMTLILAIYMILQFVFYYLAGIILPIKIIPWLTWGRDSSIEYLQSVFSAGYFRSYGIMAEPGYALTLLLPTFALYLTEKELKGRYFGLIVLSIAIMTTISVQAIIIMAVTILYGFACELFDDRMYVKPLTILAILGGGIVIILILSSGVLLPVFQRIFAIGTIGKSGGNGSTAVRLFRGFAIYSKLPLGAKLFGVGLGNVGNAVRTFGITTQYDAIQSTELDIECTNGIAGLLIMSGMIGLVIYIVLVIRLFCNSSRISRLIVIQWLLFLLAGSSFYSLDSVLLIILVYLYRANTELRCCSCEKSWKLYN